MTNEPGHRLLSMSSSSNKLNHEAKTILNALLQWLLMTSLALRNLVIAAFN